MFGSGQSCKDFAQNATTSLDQDLKLRRVVISREVVGFGAEHGVEVQDPLANAWLFFPSVDIRSRENCFLSRLPSSEYHPDNCKRNSKCCA